MSEYYAKLEELEKKRSRLWDRQEDLEAYAKTVRTYLGDASNSDFGINGSVVASAINKASNAIKTEGQWKGEVAESCSSKLDELAKEAAGQLEDFEAAYTKMINALYKQVEEVQADIRDCQSKLTTVDKLAYGSKDITLESLFG